MLTKRVYPDTPVAMHYRPIEEIDWRALVGADEVVLIITPVFLRELDEHKDHKRGALQQRARRASAWCGEVGRARNKVIRSGVRVEVNAREPELDVDFGRHGLVPSVNDDKIVACMLRDRQSDPDAQLVCVTSDNALAFKAEHAGFEVVHPPEEMRLPDEPDPVERENRQLRQKIVEMERRIDPRPDLALRFEGGGDHTTVRLAGGEAPTDEDLDEEIEAERVMLDVRYRFLEATHRLPSAQAKERYLKELRDWMVKTTKAAIDCAHTFDVRLVLANSGLGNALDIEVSLVFPPNVYVAETRSLPNVAKRPAPPEAEDKWQSPLALAEHRLMLNLNRFTALEQIVDLETLRPRGPVRIEGNGNGPHGVRIIVARSKHQTQIVLPCFQAWFGVGRRIGGFSIDYRIHAASTPDIKEGKLHVKVDAMDGPVRFLRSKLGVPDDVIPNSAEPLTDE